MHAVHDEFPQLPGLRYLNHAAVSPWPQRAVEAVTRFARENAQTGARDYPDWLKTEQRLRERLQRLLNAPACGDIALVKNTSEALSFVAFGLDWRAGDQVLISDLEYDTVKGAMRWLTDVRGVEVVELSHTHPASFDSLVQTYRDAFARYPRLKLMALTHVTHRTGLVMPVEAIAKAAREHDIDVILDGARLIVWKTPGQLPEGYFDGLAAAESPMAPALRAVGFRDGYRGLVLRGEG